jgi:hypothetical protein
MVSGSVPNTVPTDALRRPSMDPDNRTLTQIVGQNDRRNTCWKDYWAAAEYHTLDHPPPPPGQLSVPIRYPPNLAVEDYHTAVDGTCQVTMNMSNTLYRLEEDAEKRTVGRHVIRRFDDDKTRTAAAIAVLHSLRNGGQQGTRFWDTDKIHDRHTGLMASLAAIDAGRVPEDDYQIELGAKDVEGIIVHSAQGKSLKPDRKHDFFSTDIEFVNEDSKPCLASEGWLTYM